MHDTVGILDRSWRGGGQEGLLDKFPLLARQYIEDNELYISSMVELELQYLYEIKRIKQPGKTIVTELINTIGLKIDEEPLHKVIQQALSLHWTRDPFDRCIVATAKLKKAVFLTKDTFIQQHYSHSQWQ